MTIHLISVGVSLIDNILSGHRFRPDQRAFARRIAHEEPWTILGTDPVAANSWLTSALAAEDSSERDPNQARLLAETTARIQPHLWPARLSAELETFDRDPFAKRPLSPDDVAVLVSSDTLRGLAAGLWNAVALVDGDLARVRYLADPAAPIDATHGRALLVRVPGLHVGDRRGFCDAMRGLGALGHSLRYSVTHPGEAFRCHLSGGYKAAIPYLIGLAEGLRSLAGTGQVEAIVLHEDTDSGPIPLPLRWMSPKLVRNVLTEFDQNGIRTLEPESDFLEGYAYEKHGSTWHLTPFGEGLRELFGLRAEGLSG